MKFQETQRNPGNCKLVKYFRDATGMTKLSNGNFTIFADASHNRFENFHHSVSINNVLVCTLAHYNKIQMFDGSLQFDVFIQYFCITLSILQEHNKIM